MSTTSDQSPVCNSTLSVEAAEFVPSRFAANSDDVQRNGGGLPLAELPRYLTNCYPFVHNSAQRAKVNGTSGTGRGAFMSATSFSCGIRHPSPHIGPFPLQVDFSPSAHPWLPGLQCSPTFTPPVVVAPLTPGVRMPFDGGTQGIGHRLLPTSHTGDGLLPTPPYPPINSLAALNPAMMMSSYSSPQLFVPPSSKMAASGSIRGQGRQGPAGRGHGNNISRGTQKETSSYPSNVRPHTIIVKDNSVQTDFNKDIADLTLQEKPNMLYRRGQRKNKGSQPLATTDSEEVDSDSGYSSPLHRRNLVSNGTHPVRISSLVEVGDWVQTSVQSDGSRKPQGTPSGALVGAGACPDRIQKKDSASSVRKAVAVPRAHPGQARLLPGGYDREPNCSVNTEPSHNVRSPIVGWAENFGEKNITQGTGTKEQPRTLGSSKDNVRSEDDVGAVKRSQETELKGVNSSRKGSQSPGLTSILELSIKQLHGPNSNRKDMTPSPATPEFPILKPAKRNEPPWSLTPNLSKSKKGENSGYLGTVADSVKSYASIVKSLSCPSAMQTHDPSMHSSAGGTPLHGSGDQIIKETDSVASARTKDALGREPNNQQGGNTAAQLGAWGSGKSPGLVWGSASRSTEVKGSRQEYGMVMGREEPGKRLAMGREEPGKRLAMGREESGKRLVMGREEPGKRLVMGREEPGKRLVMGREEPGNRLVMGREEPGKWLVMGREEPVKRLVMGREEPGKRLVMGREESGNRLVMGREEPGKRLVMGREEPGKSLDSAETRQSWSFQKEPFELFKQNCDTPAVRFGSKGKLPSTLSSDSLPQNELACEAGVIRVSERSLHQNITGDKSPARAGKVDSTQQSGASGDEKMENEGEKRHRRRRHRRRQRKVKSTDEGLSDGMERTMSSSNISRASDVTLHFEDELEFPELGAGRYGEKLSDETSGMDRIVPSSYVTQTSDVTLHFEDELEFPESGAGRGNESSSPVLILEFEEVPARAENSVGSTHEPGAALGDENMEDDGKKKHFQRPHRWRSWQKVKSPDGDRFSDGMSGMERTASSSNISRTSDATLHCEDDLEFPELGVGSGCESLSTVDTPSEVKSLSFRRAESASSLSYSDIVKGVTDLNDRQANTKLKEKPSINDMRGRTQSAPGSCLSGEEGGDENFNSQPGQGSTGTATVSKRVRKRKKRRELANRAAEAELAEISLEQQMLRHKVSRQSSRPNSGSREEKSRSRDEKSPARGLITDQAIVRQSLESGAAGSSKPRLHQPFALSIADMLDAFEKKKNMNQKPAAIITSQTKKSTPTRDTSKQQSANFLDASAPSKRGKERETPKPKKPSPLKKVILKEREEKKRMRLIGDCDVYHDVDMPDTDTDKNDHDLIENGISGNPVGLAESDLSQDALSSHSVDTDTGVSPGADLSPISQTSPLSMSPLTPGASPLNSPIAGYLNRDPVVLRIHSRRFREYCTQILDKDIDTCCTSLLHELVRFQDRMYHKDPNKAKNKRRVVLGLREVTKHLKLKKIKCVIISPNLEKIQSKGGLDEALNNILTMCQEQNVPFVFALGRRALGRACAKLVPVSVAGIFNYEGCEEKFNQLISLTHKGREAYTEMVRAIEREIAENPPPSMSAGSSVPSLYAHMGHSRTPSGCSAISFASSVLSEPISENYPHAEPETDSKGYEIVRMPAGGVTPSGKAVGEPGSNIPAGYKPALEDFDDGNEADTEDINDYPRRKKAGSGVGKKVDDLKLVQRAEVSEILDPVVHHVEEETDPRMQHLGDEDIVERSQEASEDGDSVSENDSQHHLPPIDSIHSIAVDGNAEILSQHSSRTMENIEVLSTHSSRTQGDGTLMPSTEHSLDRPRTPEISGKSARSTRLMSKDRIQSWVESCLSEEQSPATANSRAECEEMGGENKS